ncbi:EamA family transporter [Planktothrix sp. FACHB-1355]|uniref:EamA family transporter n=1 Tax=Aerosakkonema funiforme FACHB-1375 TaxID=2949571 RepID=A0A926VBS5_9CYAN|nr:EamA family transporter [Aerosakkonema funiforme]MBD2179669.1 EamA family transporter [Aerosakkonema funiforme FACHB-1375]MBD3559434.1 EamA family transporter [Planktothrix sp. FACHB-1355]
MTFSEFGLFLVSILTSVAGQFFLKAGASKLGKVNASNWLGHIIGIITTPELLFGLACYALGACAYILLLTRVKLSVAGPAVALVYVFALLLGYFIFKETIPASRIAGLTLIVGGVVLVIWNK